MLKLTKEEEQMILKKREKEEANKPKMIGVLKHDIFINRKTDLTGRYMANDLGLYLSNKEVKQKISDFKNSFEKILSTGAIFDCYIEEDGTQSWYDRDYGIEGEDEEWAMKHLKNIKMV